MPYHIEKSGRGYYVVTSATGRRHSNSPIPLSHAEGQMRALYRAERMSPQKMKGGSMRRQTSAKHKHKNSASILHSLMTSKRFRFRHTKRRLSK